MSVPLRWLSSSKSDKGFFHLSGNDQITTVAPVFFPVDGGLKPFQDEFLALQQNLWVLLTSLKEVWPLNRWVFRFWKDGAFWYPF
jgi:hypothetical protein